MAAEPRERGPAPRRRPARLLDAARPRRPGRIVPPDRLRRRRRGRGDPGGALRNTLRKGIANLRVHALELCKQPLVATTSTPTKTTSTPTTPTSTNTTPTTTTPTTTQTTPTTPTTSGPGGGTPAPEHETP